MLTYRIGDATAPPESGPRVIAHVCNDVGRWNKGFVLAVSQRWPKARSAYFRWFREAEFALGELQVVPVEPKVWVANMVGQHGLRRRGEPQPLRYPALRKCLRALRVEAEKLHATVHMPRLGCGLGGGEWSRVEAMIEEELAPYVDVFVYDLESEA